MRFAGAWLTAAALAGCAPAAAPVPECPPVPPPHGAPLPAGKPPPTHHTLTLKPGHWDWTGHEYVWSVPEWVDIPPGGRKLWMNGFWSPAGGGCFWTQGRFIAH